MQALSVLHSGADLTLEQAIRSAAQTLEGRELAFAHGTGNAIDEASWLILHAIGLSPLQAPDYARLLTDAEITSCNALLSERIEQRTPAAYLTGYAYFAGHEFFSDARALVPRSPIAELILNGFDELVDVTSARRVLDLCTGGGCIAIACAHALPDAHIDATDISAEALALAAENVALHKMQARVSLIKTSLFDGLEQRYDLIVSNPPYVDSQDIDDMSAEFRHEPLLGLAAGRDGLDLVRVMLHQAAGLLQDDGVLVVEVGNSAEALESTYPDVPFLWLEFEYGGSGVFALTRQELLQHADAFTSALPAS